MRISMKTRTKMMRITRTTILMRTAIEHVINAGLFPFEEENEEGRRIAIERQLIPSSSLTPFSWIEKLESIFPAIARFLALSKYASIICIVIVTSIPGSCHL